jgi:hypothetical protein
MAAKRTTTEKTQNAMIGRKSRYAENTTRVRQGYMAFGAGRFIASGRSTRNGCSHEQMNYSLSSDNGATDAS